MKTSDTHEAPSSLAGGAREGTAEVLTNLLKSGGATWLTKEQEWALQSAIAALSPEAPAREGVDVNVFRRAFWRLTFDKVPAFDNPGDCKWRLSSSATRILAGAAVAALTPHHEAPDNHISDARQMVPAEGAGEPPQAAVNSLTRSVENFDNGYEWGCDPVAVRAILRHLRARSSAPEAREDYSSLIAARCVALPGKLIDCPVCLAVDNERDRQAAPSADKLRIGAMHTALMDTIREDLICQHSDAFVEEDGSELIIPSGCTPQSAFVKIDVSALADVALAALKA